MARLMLIWGIFLTVVFGVRAQGVNVAKEDGDASEEVKQYDDDLTYDETTIKDKIIEKFLWYLDPEWDGMRFTSGTTLYDAKHGAVLTVVMMPPEEVKALYEKRLKRKRVRAGYTYFAGGMYYVDSRPYYDGCKLDFSTFLKI